ncbi:hypothetical protein IE53DRAFT_386633 [Violaceomyces palustris]|uniref:Uncharacterized protein n=1 Tax=Violaceomyces palustris TaxID=1673888 RepID=A0ACD0NZ49_9BASI|nr:hypothetical protein IE53DRAFT_386633 [Violaceomyces palustris]
MAPIISRGRSQRSRKPPRLDFVPLTERSPLDATTLSSHPTTSTLSPSKQPDQQDLPFEKSRTRSTIHRKPLSQLDSNLASPFQPQQHPPSSAKVQPIHPTRRRRTFNPLPPASSTAEAPETETSAGDFADATSTVPNVPAPKLESEASTAPSTTARSTRRKNKLLASMPDEVPDIPPKCLAPIRRQGLSRRPRPPTRSVARMASPSSRSHPSTMDSIEQKKGDERRKKPEMTREMEEEKGQVTDEENQVESEAPPSKTVASQSSSAGGGATILVRETPSAAPPESQQEAESDDLEYVDLDRFRSFSKAKAKSPDREEEEGKERGNDTAELSLSHSEQGEEDDLSDKENRPPPIQTAAAPIQSGPLHSTPLAQRVQTSGPATMRSDLAVVKPASPSQRVRKVRAASNLRISTLDEAMGTMIASSFTSPSSSPPTLAQASTFNVYEEAGKVKAADWRKRLEMENFGDLSGGERVERNDPVEWPEEREGEERKRKSRGLESSDDPFGFLEVEKRLKAKREARVEEAKREVVEERQLEAGSEGLPRGGEEEGKFKEDNESRGERGEAEGIAGSASISPSKREQDEELARRAFASPSPSPPSNGDWRIRATEGESLGDEDAAAGRTSIQGEGAERPAELGARSSSPLSEPEASSDEAGGGSSASSVIKLSPPPGDKTRRRNAMGRRMLTKQDIEKVVRGSSPSSSSVDGKKKSLRLDEILSFLPPTRESKKGKKVAKGRGKGGGRGGRGQEGGEGRRRGRGKEEVEEEAKARRSTSTAHGRLKVSHATVRAARRRGREGRANGSGKRREEEEEEEGGPADSSSHQASGSETDETMEAGKERMGKSKGGGAGKANGKGKGKKEGEGKGEASEARDGRGTAKKGRSKRKKREEEEDYFGVSDTSSRERRLRLFKSLDDYELESELVIF